MADFSPLENDYKLISKKKKSDSIPAAWSFALEANKIARKLRPSRMRIPPLDASNI